MTALGCDTAQNTAAAAPHLKASGVTFVGRYLGGGTWKRLTADELHALNAAGLGVIVFYEGSGQEPKQGHDKGISDAREALSEATAIGYTGAINLTADYDLVTEADFAAALAYYQGALTVLGSRNGAYGEYELIKRAFDAGAIHWAVQTYAWSQDHNHVPQWDSRAQVRQVKNHQAMAGLTVDICVAMVPNYGQQPAPTAPATPAAPAKVKVSQAAIQAAAQRDPSAAQGHLTHAHDVLPVERALVGEGLLDKRWVDGSFGSKTVAAYAAWQRHLGYSGAAADGVPGIKSLTALGRRRGFIVTR